jgi:hypothetical protein
MKEGEKNMEAAARLAAMESLYSLAHFYTVMSSQLFPFVRNRQSQ